MNWPRGVLRLGLAAGVLACAGVLLLSTWPPLDDYTATARFDLTDEHLRNSRGITILDWQRQIDDKCAAESRAKGEASLGYVFLD
ncbi:MAG: hypothetical protein ACREB3_03405, partial [Burkholderiales bacterium]